MKIFEESTALPSNFSNFQKQIEKFDGSTVLSSRIFEKFVLGTLCSCPQTRDYQDAQPQAEQRPGAARRLPPTLAVAAEDAGEGRDLVWVRGRQLPQQLQVPRIPSRTPSLDS